MSTEIEKTVIQKLRSLTPEQQREVAEFVDRLARSRSLGATGGFRPIWEEIAEISAQVPKEAWESVPVDGSEQHDHYLYGAPKRKS